MVQQFSISQNVLGVMYVTTVSWERNGMLRWINAIRMVLREPLWGMCASAPTKLVFEVVRCWPVSESVRLSAKSFNRRVQVSAPHLTDCIEELTPKGSQWRMKLNVNSTSSWSAATFVADHHGSMLTYNICTGPAGGGQQGEQRPNHSLLYLWPFPGHQLKGPYRQPPRDHYNSHSLASAKNK